MTSETTPIIIRISQPYRRPRCQTNSTEPKQSSQTSPARAQNHSSALLSDPITVPSCKLRKRGYTYTFQWTIDSLDWTGNSATDIYNRVINNVVPGAIVLLHAGYGANGRLPHCRTSSISACDGLLVRDPFSAYEHHKHAGNRNELHSPSW